MPGVVHVRGRDGRFQQWAALLDNRAKRARTGEFLVHGVRPITLAVRHGWDVRMVLSAAGATPSAWARGILSAAPHQAVLPAELLAELGDRDAGPELIAVAATRPDDLDRIRCGPAALVVVFDRPASPGNLGTLVRSADAFGAAGVIVTGHAADPYDPRAVRASTGSLFALPVVRAASHREVTAWVAAVRATGVPLAVVGADESATTDVDAVDLTGPTLLAVGSEARGLSAGWRAACEHAVRIPIGGAASSLNAATAATVILYEASRQRRAAGRPVGPGRPPEIASPPSMPQDRRG